VKKIQVFNKVKEIVRYNVTDRESGASIVIQPDTLSAHRPYPIYVYMLAAAMCVLGGMTQRGAAKSAGAAFGIASFSASTVCRVLRLLSEEAWLLLESEGMRRGRVDGDILECVRAAVGGPARSAQAGRCDLASALLGFARACGMARGSQWRVPPGLAAAAAGAAGALCRGFFSLSGRYPV